MSAIETFVYRHRSWQPHTPAEPNILPQVRPPAAPPVPASTSYGEHLLGDTNALSHTTGGLFAVGITFETHHCGFAHAITCMKDFCAETALHRSIEWPSLAVARGAQHDCLARPTAARFLCHHKILPKSMPLGQGAGGSVPSKSVVVLELVLTQGHWLARSLAAVPATEENHHHANSVGANLVWCCSAGYGVLRSTRMMWTTARSSMIGVGGERRVVMSISAKAHRRPRGFLEL